MNNHLIFLETGNKTTIQRRCEPANIFGIHCKTENQGDVSAVTCTCNSENCNKDHSCYCGGSAQATLSLFSIGLIFLVSKMNQ